MRRIITTLAVLLGIGVLATPVAAQTTPTTTTIVGATTTTVATSVTIPGGLTVNGALTIVPASTPVVAGTKVAVTGSGVTPGTASLNLVSASNTSGIALGTASVSAAGVLSAEITVPANAAEGTWYVRAIDGSSKLFAGQLVIGGNATTTTVVKTPGALPNNGPLATLPMIVGAAVLGFAGIFFARRTRNA